MNKLISTIERSIGPLICENRKNIDYNNIIKLELIIEPDTKYNDLNDGSPNDKKITIKLL